MNICFLTDEQKRKVFGERQDYTADHLNSLALVASANESLTKTILTYCVDGGPAPVFWTLC